MKDILKYGILTGIYILLIVPFLVGDGTFLPSMFFPFITGKAFVFRIAVEILFGLWLILIIKDKEFRPKFSWILACAGIFTAVLFVADIFAMAPYKAFWSNFERMEGWVTIIHLLAYILVLSSMLRTEKLWLWFLRANVCAGLIMAITSLSKASDVRFSGPLGNSIYLGIYFLFIFFFTLVLWYKDVLVKKKVLANALFYIYPIVAALSFYITYRTSRGVVLGALGGLFVSAVLITLFEKERKVLRQVSGGIVVAVVAIVIIFIGARQTSFVQNNPTLSRLAAISLTSGDGEARSYIWPMALKGFKEKPILGWGQEGFNYVFNKYYDPRMYSQEQWFDRAHNTPLDFLIDGGILGLLSYLSLFISALYLLWFRKNNLPVTEKALFTGLFAGYFFQGLFVFDNLVSYMMFFTTLAYVHSRIVENQDVVGKRWAALSDIIKNEEYQNYILIPAVIILTIVAVYYVNMPAISANSTLIQALDLAQMGKITDSENAFKQALAYHSLGDSEIREQLLSFAPAVAQSPQIDNQTKIDIVNFTASEVDKQIAIVPNDARYYILQGSFLNSIGASDKALPYIQRAVALSPAKQTMHFQLMQALLNLGQTDQALAEAKLTYELDKNDDQAKQIYEAVVSNVIKMKPAYKAEGTKLLQELSATTTAL